ncbi:MAG: SIMPL domain-containing protein [Planctomycetia bacterium]|jgi:uncharacterized protein YggE
MKTKVIAVLMVVAAACPAWGQYPKQPQITVSGSAMVNVKPDKVVLSFGIKTFDEDVMTAKNQNDTILKKALASLKALEIPAKEIQTNQLSIAPRYEDHHMHQQLLGYEVSNAFIVTLTDPAKVEPLVTQMLQDGVNYVHGIDFQTTEFKKYREQARELALKAAKEKAEKMAAVLDQKVGAPLQITENSYYGGSSRYISAWSWWGGRGSVGMAQNVVQNVQSGGGDDLVETIALGKIAIKAQVNVSFRLQSEAEGRVYPTTTPYRPSSPYRSSVPPSVPPVYPAPPSSWNPSSTPPSTPAPTLLPDPNQ